MNKTKDMPTPAPQGKVTESQKTRLPRLTPAVDIYESDNAFQLLADLPGVVRENISINVEKGKLSLSATRSGVSSKEANWQEFADVEYERIFSVPQTIEVDRIEAQFSDGVLNLHLPKSAAAQPRKISIATA